MVGIDLVQISRIKLEQSFIQMILTPEEQAEYAGKQYDNARREYLAGRFAAKEAIFKAAQDPHYLEYAVLNEPSGRPYVKDHPELQLSITHDGDYAAAIAIIEKKP
ncbi:MAG: holo-ACP synthase [Solobacterium sp.]|nr:holo-ACP synthase [Solobacterium sp.]MCH4266341.1 holo-ACP synthase [Solobacterium sp.]